MRLRATAVALVAGALVAGCSSDPADTAPPGAPQPSTSVATQWWSAKGYCGILRQTLLAGHSILPGAAAGDPELLTATRKFVASVTAAAPGKVRAQWQVLGPALTQLVETGGTPGNISGVNTRLVAQAAAAIASDAKKRCQLDVSS